MRNRTKFFSFVCASLLLAGGFLLSSLSLAEVVTLNPNNPNPLPGDTVCVQVNVSNVTELYAASFDLNYTPAVLDYLGTTEGTFLNQDGQSTVMEAAPLNNIKQ